MDKSPPKAPLRKRFLERPLPKHPNSTKHAYILVFGTPGSGKSTTINMLFANREICVISSQEGTSSVQEFSTNLRSGRNLKILDTPALGGSSIVWDTKVLASLKKYLDTDPELRHCIPNIVLIVGRFDDPQLSDLEGPFVKTLKAINLLNSRLFDKFSCNVVVLLTHFCGGEQGYRDNPRYRQDEVMDLIKNHTQFPQMPYIVFGENVNVSELGSVSHEEFGRGFYRVWNSYYPSNLIELVIKISGGSTKGALGPEFFRNVFRHRESIFLWQSVNLSLVLSERKRFRKAFYLLNEVYKDEGES